MDFVTAKSAANLCTKLELKFEFNELCPYCNLFNIFEKPFFGIKFFSKHFKQIYLIDLNKKLLLLIKIYSLL